MDEILIRRTVIENPFIAPARELLGRFDDGQHKFPSPQQRVFLAAPVEEILYGGAAGGGKSAGILAAALQYVTETGYNALIVRRSYADLEKPGALIPMSMQWLTGLATYNPQSHRWTFPSGATLSFGYIQNELSVQQDYKGSAFAFIGFDELTDFTEFMYRYLFSRLRIAKGLAFPVRIRATTNPGGIGHEWVKSWFFDTKSPDRFFIPAKLQDNPGLDRQQYEKSMERLDPVTRAQLRDGNWDIRPQGNLFKRAWFGAPVDVIPPIVRTVRAWDLAATEVGKNKDPDWTVGAKIGIASDKTCYLINIIRDRLTPQNVETLIRRMAEQDGKNVSIRIEREGGASGKSIVDHYQRNVLFGFDCRGEPVISDKVTRAQPFSAACERGGVKLLRGTWNESFLDELTSFPCEGMHDDQVDAATGAFNSLSSVVTFNSGFTIGGAG